MIELAPAKINLFLHVGGRRSDGYHDLESLVTFAQQSDKLAFEPSENLSLAIDGPFGESLDGSEANLVLKAARLLANKMRVSPQARITLTKNLPVSSGLGGGSADAAATLRGLARLWKCQLQSLERMELALSLGSDVPVCLASSTAWIEGRGERMSSAAQIPRLGILLVNPGIAVSTASVFAGARGSRELDTRRPEKWHSVPAFIEFLRGTRNDLEKPARALAPEIGEALDALAACGGVLLTRMSGSGGTCFGLFSDGSTTRAAAERIASRHPYWWVSPTSLLG